MQQKSNSGILSPRWLVPLGILIFCVIVITITTTFERMPPILKRGIQPADFPQIVTGLIFVLTLLSLWREPIEVFEKLGLNTWGTLGLIPLFVVLAPVDFFLGLGLFAFGMAVLWGERRLPLLSLVGVVVPAAVFLLFDLIFEIRFPRGILTSLWYG